MELRTVIIFVFFTSAFLYLMGYQPAFLYIWGQYNYSPSALFDALFKAITGIVTDPTFLAVFGTATVITLVSSSGQGLVSLVFPVFLAGILLNTFFLPTSYLFSAGLPEFLKMFIQGLLNIMLAIGLINFVRGSPA